MLFHIIVALSWFGH